jgi:transposase
VQGYNAQAVTTCEQVIVAAELTQDANDLQQLAPMLKATTTTLAAAGIQERPDTLLADSGYWSIANLTKIPDAPELLIPPAKHARQRRPRKDGKPSASKGEGLRAAMTAKLNSGDGKARYAKRKQTVEPVFGQIKDVRGAGPTGSAPRLSDAQLAAIDQALRQGARAHGFDSDLWTLARVTTVIKRLTGVAYHPGHTWKLLRHRLHYRLQLPARRAVIVFWDESGASLLPVTRRTWAPRGHTLVICHRFNWKRTSMAAALDHRSATGPVAAVRHWPSTTTPTPTTPTA